MLGIGFTLGLDDAAAGRLREAGRVVFRADDRAEGFGPDLGLFMGSSEVCTAHPPHHLSPA